MNPACNGSAGRSPRDARDAAAQITLRTGGRLVTQDRQATRAALDGASRVRLLAGGGLLLGAWLGPWSSLRAQLVAPEPDASLLILRACLALGGAGLLLRATLLRRAFDGPGLPGLLYEAHAPETPRSVRRTRAWLALLIALGAALRFVGLDQDFWIDEIATVVNYLRLPVGRVLQTYTSANQHLLYSLLGSLSFSAFGEGHRAARLPAFALGVAAIPVVYLLGRAIAGRREALSATALLTLSYHHVWFSQVARGYAGMITFSALGTLLFLHALARNRGLVWTGYVASMTLGVLCLQNTAFVLLAQAAAYLVSQRCLRPALRALTARVLWSAGSVALLSVAGHAFVLPQMLGFFAEVDRTGLGFPSASALLPVVRGGLLAGLGLAGAALLSLLLGAGALSFARRSPLVAGLLVLPAAFNLAALALLRYGAYPRSFLYVLPLALLMTVRGAYTLGDLARRRFAPGAQGFGAQAARALPPLVLGLLLLASAASLWRNYRYPKQDYRGALAYVQARRGPHDEIAAVGLAAVAYRLYYAPGLRFPETPAELRALGGPGRAVWVLFSFPRDMRLRFPRLFDEVERECRVVATFEGTLGDGDLYVARRGP